ncbi:MAG: PAS domain-containing protein [Euryarchaeota archaeon]|nr:PAS domain-containing protein [Euryarchaeota archaeon]
MELRFRDVAGAMSDWVWEVDSDVRYTYCSEKVKDVPGYTAGEMLGKTPFDFMMPDEMAEAGAEFC